MLWKTVTGQNFKGVSWLTYCWSHHKEFLSCVFEHHEQEITMTWDMIIWKAYSLPALFMKRERKQSIWLYIVWSFGTIWCTTWEKSHSNIHMSWMSLLKQSIWSLDHRSTMTSFITLLFFSCMEKYTEIDGSKNHWCADVNCQYKESTMHCDDDIIHKIIATIPHFQR